MFFRLESLFKKSFLLFSLLIIITFNISAQTSGANLEIVVKDKNNSAISGANIVLRNPKTGFEKSAVTNADGSYPALNAVIGKLLFFNKNLASIYTQGVEFDTEIVLPRGFMVGGAYTYLDAKYKTTDLYLLSRNKHQGFAKFGYANDRYGFRTNLRGSFYSSSINARSATNVYTISPKFQIRDLYAPKSVPKRLEVYGSIDNLFDNQDPNTGVVNTSNSPLPLYRAEIGRSFRVRFRWTFGKDR